MVSAEMVSTKSVCERECVCVYERERREMILEYDVPCFIITHHGTSLYAFLPDSAFNN